MSIEYTFSVKGDTVTFEGTSDEIVESALLFSKRSDEFTEAVAVIKQAVLAKGVFTGNTEVGGSVRALAADSGFVETGPPGDDVPSCKHGKMTDLRGQSNKAGEPYKNSFYCPLKTNNWKEKCKPI